MYSDDGSLEPFPIPPEVLKQIEQHLINRRNFHLGSYKDSYIRRRISLRIRANGCGTAESYLKFLLAEEAELDYLLKVLNVHVSQFFRNPNVFALLRHQILPELLGLGTQKTKDSVNIWSVGCAGGEEPYSLALLIRHYFPAEASRVAIVGTDVDPGIVAAARKGLFRAERLVDLPEEMRELYFQRSRQWHQLDREVMSMVTFRQADLFDPESFRPSDLILCRNVLIYFEAWQQERIVARFAEVLREGGILVLGSAETIPAHLRCCFEAISPTERIYRRVNHQ